MVHGVGAYIALAWNRDKYGALSATKLIDVLGAALGDAVRNGVHLGLKDNWRSRHLRIKEIAGKAVAAYNQRTTGEKKKAKERWQTKSEK